MEEHPTPPASDGGSARTPPEPGAFASQGAAYGAAERERPARIADLLTVALLAALIAVQTLGAGQAIVIDARVPAVVVAAAMFALRVPFIVVVVAAALVAAGIRAFA